MLIAIGIGLHNFGEGLAIGSAFSARRAGTRDAADRRLHAAQHDRRTGHCRAAGAKPANVSASRRLIQLGLIGGVPTILGAWLGAFVYSPALAVLFLALGVGGIAQVTRQIVKQSAGERGLSTYLRQGPALAGLTAGVMIMYVTGLIVG